MMLPSKKCGPRLLLFGANIHRISQKRKKQYNESMLGVWHAELCEVAII